jgi:DNA-binding transcriptional LysR family regulator
MCDAIGNETSSSSTYWWRTSPMCPLTASNREEGFERCAFTSNSVLASIEAAAAGMGLSLIAAAFAEGDERLVRVTDPIEHLTLQLWILMHPDLRRTARITALTRFLAERLTKHQSMFLAGKSGTTLVDPAC